eukprot:723281-Amphidinium_carterae.1
MNASEWCSQGLSERCGDNALEVAIDVDTSTSQEASHGGTTDRQSCFAEWLGAGLQVRQESHHVEELPLQVDADDVQMPAYAPARRKRGRPCSRDEVAIAQFPAAASTSTGSNIAPAAAAAAAATAKDEIQQGLVPKPLLVFAEVESATSGKLPEMLSHIRRPIAGYCLPPTSSSALVYCAKQAEGCLSMDSDICKIADVSLSGDSYHCASTTMRATQLGIPERSYQRKLVNLAAAQYCSSRLVRHILEEKLAASQPHVILLGCVEAHAYDETPLRSSVLVHQDLSEMHRSASVAQGGVNSQFALLRQLRACMKQEGVTCKVLQDQQWFGMVIKKGDVYLKLVGEQVAPLQVLEQTTAETMCKALQQQSYSGRACSNFKFKALLTASDRAAYNMKGEKEMVKQRDPPWSLLSLFCEIHDNNRVFSGCVESLFDTHVTGIINTALSLRHNGTLSAFRAALREEIQATLVIKRGRCSVDAQQHKQRVLQVFSVGSGKSISQLMLLAVLPNGDWRVGDCVEHYVQDEVPLDAYPAIATAMESGLMLSLLAKKPTVWCRHRWTGCQAALCELGLLTAIHSLLPRAYCRFLSKLKATKDVITTSDTAGNAMMKTQSMIDAEAAIGLGLLPLMQNAGEATDLQHASGGAPPIGTAISWAAENETQRRKSSQWLQSEPLPFLSLLAICVAPLQALMHKQLEVAGKFWDQKQNVEAIRRLAACDFEGFLARDYQITLAAGGVMEANFLQDLRLAFTDYDRWLVIEEQYRDVSMNAKAFAILSRSGAMIEKSLGMSHKTFPVKLFKLLLKPDEASSLAGTRTCLMDAWSKDLLTVCPGYEGADCLHLLHLHAVLAATSTAKVESLHSSIRRQLVLRSVQTHTLPVSALSAEFLLQQMRNCKQALDELCCSKADACSSKSRRQVETGSQATSKHHPSILSHLSASVLLLTCNHAHVCRSLLKSLTIFHSLTASSVRQRLLWASDKFSDKTQCRSHEFHTPIPSQSNTLACFSLSEVIRAPRVKHKKQEAGTWRAWVRMHTFQNPEKANFSELSIAYREAKANNSPSFQRCMVMSAASKRAFACKKVGGLFGARGRHCKKTAYRMSSLALWARCRTKTSLQKAAIVAAQAKGTDTLAEALSAAKRHDFLEGTARRKAETEQKDTLSAWHMANAEEQLARLKNALPKFPWNGLPVLPLPSAHGLLYYLPCQGNEAASQALACATASQKSNLSAFLGKEWEEMHETIQQPNFKYASEKTSSRPCREEGVCLCDQSGSKLYTMRNKLLKEMKITFGTKIRKEQLSAGQVLLRFSLEKQCSQCAAREGCLAKMEWIHHVAHMSFSPYRPTLHLLERLCPLTAEQKYDGGTSSFKACFSTGAGEEDNYTGAWGSLLPKLSCLLGLSLHAGARFQATLEFYTDYHALDLLCKQCSWGLAWLALEQTGRPLTQLQPDIVSAGAAYGCYDAFHFWPLTRPRRASAKSSAWRHHLAGHVSVADSQTLAGHQPLEDMDLQDDDDWDACEAVLPPDAEPEEEPLEENEQLLLQAKALDYLMSLEEERREEHAASRNSVPKPGARDSANERNENLASEQPCGTSSVDPAACSSVVATSSEVTLGAASSELPHRDDVTAQRLAPLRGDLSSAAAVVHFPHGRISYYDSKSSFEAICTRHANCKLLRTAKAKKRRIASDEHPVGGRPLGLLAAWLLDAEPGSKETHRDTTKLLSYKTATRQAARAELSSKAGGAELLALERPTLTGEPDEPEHLYGYF